MRFSVFFVFLILSYQNACNGCENAENRTWSEIVFDRRKFQRQCATMIDTTWGRIYLWTCEIFGRNFRTQCAEILSVPYSKVLPSEVLSSVEHKRRYSEECGKPKKVDGSRWKEYYWSQWGAETVWFPAFFKSSSFVSKWCFLDFLSSNYSTIYKKTLHATSKFKVLNSKSSHFVFKIKKWCRDNFHS